MGLVEGLVADRSVMRYVVIIVFWDSRRYNLCVIIKQIGYNMSKIKCYILMLKLKLIYGRKVEYS